MNLRKYLFFTAIIAVNLGVILSCTSKKTISP